MGFGYRQLPVAGRKEDRPAVRWKGNAGYDANIVNNSDHNVLTIAFLNLFCFCYRTKQVSSLQMYYH